VTAPAADPDGVRIRTDLRCGDLGRIVALHGTAYSALPGFGLRFEAFVARTVAEYVLDNDSKGCIWLAETDHGALAGCAAIAERTRGTGQLRWVLVDPVLRGAGLGRTLVTRAMDYCIARNLERVRLETTEGLPVSMKLYQHLGFETVSSEPAELWNGQRALIVMEKTLGHQDTGTV
jgi:GNAT superfamily N-acetyltransferase